jgi:5-formyltetrahydrofolate cyclo-ligase
MVDPPPDETSTVLTVPDKQRLRQQLRGKRRKHVESLPQAVRALVFSRPPTVVAELVPRGASVGLYYAAAAEAPTLAYARWFHERGNPLALPWFGGRNSPMAFRHWPDPWDDERLQPGPFGLMQPPGKNRAITPDVLFVPLVGFTASGDRLGQGGGHYDRWLAANPSVPAIGLAWDCQRLDTLPREPHDQALALIVTQTRVHMGEA